MRLTEAQQAVLRRLRDGDILHCLTGLDGQAFWHDDLGTVRLNTVFALERRELIERAAWRAGGGEFRLTEAGRRALEQEG